MLLAAVALWALSPLAAHALSLADLATEGASFSSLDGQLTFGGFDVSDLAASGFDPQFIDVVPIELGFQLVPADDWLRVFDGRIEDPLFHFDVESTLGIQGVRLGIGNAFEGPLARGPGSAVRVEVSGDSLAALLVAELAAGQEGSAADRAASAGGSTLTLWTRVDLLSGDPDGSALFPRIEYRFETEVPEPGTTSLLLLGLAGAGWIRRRL